MAGTFVPNMIQGTALDLNSQQSRKITAGIVKDIDTTADPAELIWHAKTVLEAAGYGLGVALTGHTSHLVSRIMLRGIDDTSVYVEVFHETPQWGGTPTAYLVRDDAYLVSDRTRRNPATGKLLVVNKFTHPVTGEVIEGDVLEVSFLRPMRAVVLSALSIGQPATGGQDAIGAVNNPGWYGKGAAYWLLTKYKTEVAKYSGYYSLEAIALSKVVEDWSSYGVLRNEQTGKYCVDETSYATIVAGTYSNSPFHGNGCSRFGLYPGLNFFSIFGF